MSDPINVERDIFSHIAAAHLRTGNRMRMRSRFEKVDLIAKPVDLMYSVVEKKPGVVNTCVSYATARDAVFRVLDVQKLWKVPLGDLEFANMRGTIAVTWRHLRVRLSTLRLILTDDGDVIAGILKEAENL